MDDIRTPEPLIIDDDQLPTDHTRDAGTMPPERGVIDTPEDPVDEASDESFPASDPPSFTGSTTD